MLDLYVYVICSVYVIYNVYVIYSGRTYWRSSCMLASCHAEALCANNKHVNTDIAMLTDRKIDRSIDDR